GGYAGPALIVWVVGGLLSLLGALAYGDLGAMNPSAGGLYIYLLDAFGPVTAVLYSWTFVLLVATRTAGTPASHPRRRAPPVIAVRPVRQNDAVLALLAGVSVLHVRISLRRPVVDEGSEAHVFAAVVTIRLARETCGEFGARVEPPPGTPVVPAAVEARM